MKFNTIIINNTINKLLEGLDYRDEIINAINLEFFDFTLVFFKKILDAKLKNKSIDFTWYKKYFINNKDLKSDEAVIFAGINKKTISNIYGKTTKEIMLNIANANIEYLENMIQYLDNEDENIGISIKISYKEISVELNLSESLLIINALATKKIALRGGAWSSIGKKVEKPLMLKLCKKSGISDGFINDEIFKKDNSLDFDREVDFKLYNSDKSKEYRVEVKLMGKGNPESADAVIARKIDIFIADTLSQQNKEQLKKLKIKFLELKNNKDCIKDFQKILKNLNIPFYKVNKN